MKAIKIYTTPTCVYCKMAKEYFKSLNLNYSEVNVAENDAERDLMVQKSGQLGVPVIEIGDSVLVGFNKKEVDAALA